MCDLSRGTARRASRQSPLGPSLRIRLLLAMILGEVLDWKRVMPRPSKHLLATALDWYAFQEVGSPGHARAHLPRDVAQKHAPPEVAARRDAASRATSREPCSPDLRDANDRQANLPLTELRVERFLILEDRYP